MSLTPAPNISIVANSTTLANATRVDPVVVGLGIVVLILLFAASFYYTVIWPRRSMIEYRRKFEMLVRTEQIHRDEKQLKVVAGGEKLYGGARMSPDVRRIPTYKEIEMAKKNPTVISPHGSPGEEDKKPLLVDPASQRKVFAPDL